MRRKVLIVADDLTGTCDTSIKFLRRNMRVTTIVNARDFCKTCLEQDDVVAANTETRDLSPEEAYQRVYRLVREVANTNTIIFKKIDSVLRGNIASEIDATMDATDLQLAVVVPAYPDNGRQSRNGILHIKGENGWASQGEEKSWSRVLGECKRKAVIVPIGVVREGKEAISTAIMDRYAAGGSVVFVDAETNDDLRNIALSIAEIRNRLRVLPVGCAGLAAYLSEEMLGNTTAGLIFIIVGTNHPATQLQLQHIAHRNDLAFYSIDVDQMHNGACLPEIKRVVEGVRQDLQARRLKTGAVLTVNAPQIEEDDGTEAARMIVRALSQTAKEIFDSTPQLFDKFLISGGDTANSVLDALGIKSIHMLDEPLPGIAYGWADVQGTESQKAWIATKSGGFGTAESLDRLIDYMCTGKPQ